MRSRTERWELAATLLLLVWFAARIVWLALRIHPFVPPDEVTHLARVLAFAQVLGVPDDGPGTFEHGLVGRAPWLYYWLMARSLALNVFALPDLLFLRLANGLLGLATVAIGVCWLRDWCASAWARVLFAVLLSNTLMFTGLAGSVSYDNGANLLAAGAMLSFTRFRLSRRIEWLLALAAFLLAGVLAKRTLLPFAFLIVLLLVWRERRELRALPGRAADMLRGAGAGRIALLAAVVVLGLLSLELYGGNLARYRKLYPDLDQVVGVENAMQNRVFARGRILDRFRSGELAISDARELASQIRHEGDRAATLFLLEAAQRPESPVLGPIAYVPRWGWGMLRSAVGYVGHRSVFKSNAAVAGYALIFAAAVVLIANRWRPDAAGGVPADAAFLVLGYLAVLMWLVHYPSYQESRYLELALQGRYLFPVLVPLYGVVAWSLGELAPQRARPFVVAATAAFYLYGDLPWFVQQIGERWLMVR